jgi:hypothetical protein
MCSTDPTGLEQVYSDGQGHYIVISYPGTGYVVGANDGSGERAFSGERVDGDGIETTPTEKLVEELRRRNKDFDLDIDPSSVREINKGKEGFAIGLEDGSWITFDYEGKLKTRGRAEGGLEDSSWIVLDSITFFKGGIKLVGRSSVQKLAQKNADEILETIYADTTLKDASALRFGADDLVYGPSAGGKLRELADSAGGRLLTDVGGPAPGQSWLQFSIQTLEDQLEAGGKIRFDLTNMIDVEGALKGTGPWGNTVTAGELRYLQQNWSRFSNSTSFYRNGLQVAAPW